MAGQTLSGCPVFPQNNIWNARVDSLPVHPNSTNYVNRIGAANHAHADFGSGLWDGGPIGIPFVVVPGTQPKVPISFQYAGDSDAGPYPIPPNPPIEGGNQSTGDRHVLVLDKDNCILYEVYAGYPQSNGSWQAGSGAIFDLKGNALRTATWTSADAAGLPILPGLVRYDEVAAGEIRHAIRFTVPQTQKAFVWPGRHQASSITDTTYPPMGARFRLKASVNISTYSADTQVILRAMQTYGLLLADNGSAWYISGAPDERWNNSHLAEFGNLRGTDFEAVDESSLMLDPNLGQVRVGQALAPLAVSPASGSGASQTFTFTFSDPAGWQDLGVVNVLINSALMGGQACYLAYSRPVNTLYLVDDGNTGLLPGLTMNGSGSVSNSQCTVNGAGSSVTGSGNTMTLTLNLSFAAGFAGRQLIYTAAGTQSFANSGWHALGVWQVPPGAAASPSVTSVTPTRGAGLSQVRHVHQQTSVDVQLDALPVLGDSRRVAEGAVLAVPAGTEAGLVAIGGDDLARGADVHLAAFGVDNYGVALVHALQHAARIADGRNAERLGDDGDVALAAGVLQH